MNISEQLAALVGQQVFIDSNTVGILRLNPDHCEYSLEGAECPSFSLDDVHRIKGTYIEMDGSYLSCYYQELIDDARTYEIYEPDYDETPDYGRWPDRDTFLENGGDPTDYPDILRD